MSHLKTVTSAVTAVLLVSGIGLAVAQSEDSLPVTQPATMTQPADQAPVDSTAMPLNDTTAQQQPADPTRSQPPADPTAPLPAQDPAQMQATQPAQDSSMPSSTPSYDAASEPAPRADRN
jgi:hypothetical protein